MGDFFFPGSCTDDDEYAAHLRNNAGTWSSKEYAEKQLKEYERYKRNKQ